MSNFMRKRRQGGFTLIELMIVVAIVAILALLAIFGVSKFLANAKTAEATNTIGQINKLSIQAYERESAPAELSLTGGASANAMHALCGNSTLVPATFGNIQNKRYTPTAADYTVLAAGTNDNRNGWNCLKHEMTEPQYYQYAYTKGAAARVAGAPAGIPAGTSWLSEASGDLDGDAIPSYFITGGGLAADLRPIPFTQMVIQNPEE